MRFSVPCPRPLWSAARHGGLFGHGCHRFHFELWPSSLSLRLRRFPVASLASSLLLSLAALLPLAPARAFDVFCVSNGDGTTTCEGWQGGETLTCVGSPGGVSTCTVPSGRRFTCTISSGGATTCSDNVTDRPDGDGTNCTFTGDGNFVCDPPPRRSQPLLPGPTLPPLQDRPDLPAPAPVITNPSVF